MSTANVRITTQTSDTFGNDDEILVVKPSTSAAIAVPNLVRAKIDDSRSISKIAIIKNAGPGVVVISDPDGHTIDGQPNLTIGPGTTVTITGTVTEYGLIATGTNL
jgi:hypothetical protein